MSEQPSTKQPAMRWGIIILSIVFLMLILQRAWMSDDAFITLRTVDNFVNGYGLVWNVGERVQSYTHPLWMFVLSGAYFVTREAFFTTIVVSLLISIITLLILTTRVARSTWGAIFGITALLFANAYLDYSTSGLENPLTHLLIVVFYAVYFRTETFTPRRLFELSFVASLAGFNRLDTVLIYAPALLWAWLQSKDKKRGLLMGILGQFPLILWELFSLFYYGFPLPNTYYAKLNSGFPSNILFIQGIQYLLYTVKADLFMAIALLGGLVAAFTSNEKRQIPLAISTLVYLAYILKIGGDFMGGRFFTAAYLCAVIAITRFDYKILPDMGRWATLLLTMGMGIILLQSPNLANVTGGLVTSDHRLFLDNYGFSLGLFSRNYRALPTGVISADGMMHRYRASEVTQPPFTQGTATGIFGYSAGPDVFIMDIFALAEPLLARLPAIWNPNFLIGHFERTIPDGYEQTLQFGQNVLVDANLATYYEHLSLIVHDELWSWPRLKTIVAMNLGHYDYLIDEFRYKYPDIVTVDIADIPFQDGDITCQHEQAITIDNSGLLVNMSPEHQFNPTLLTLGASPGTAYMVHYLAGQKIVAEQILPHDLRPTNQIVNKIQPLPENMTEAFEQVHIFPIYTIQSNPCIAYLSFDLTHRLTEQQVLQEAIAIVDQKLFLRHWSLSGDTHVQPGDTVVVQSWWSVPDTIEENISVEITVVSESDATEALIQKNKYLYTASWQPNLIQTKFFSIIIPENATQGEYPLLLTAHDGNTGQSRDFSAADGTPQGDHIYLTTLTVEEASPTPEETSTEN